MRIEGMRQASPIEPLKNDTQKQGPDVAMDTSKIGQREKEQEEAPKNIKSMEKALDILNKTMEVYNTELRFTMHKKSGEFIIKVINTTDNTVIREIPPERVLDMIAQMKEMMGLIVDKFI